MSKKFNRFLALLILLPCMFIMVGCKKNKNNNNNNNNPPQSYSISYELNGGVNNSDNPTSYTSLSETITFKSPTKENYDFIGWYLDEDFTIEISKIEKGSTGNKTLYARFNPTIFTIEYILNGGEIAENSKVEYTIISDTITLLEPTKNGYDFGGWYTDENFTIRETEIVKGSSGNKKFFARWIPVVYSITYELNGGINNTNNKSDYTIETPTFNFSNPTKLGYDFDGWYLENNFTTKVTEIKVGTIGNKTFYAKWKATIYSVNYELSGGNNNSNNPEYYTIESNTISLLEPTKTGYYFDGWYLDSDFVTPVTKIEKGTTGPKKFYASFKPETYKITFDYADADGNNEVTDIDVIFDMKVGELPIPTKTNYDFLGWWYNSTLFEDETVYKVAGNITLTASWKEKDAVIETFDVVFDTNGGSAIESQEDVVFGSKISKPIDPTKLGYKFVAWLYNGNEWDFDVQSVTKNITLVAEWELINYTIIYHLYDGHNDSTNPETYTILSENITLKKAFKDGYSFRGWFTDDKFTNKIEVIETGSTGEINLYAQFAEIETGAYAKVSFKYNLPSCVSNLYKDFERDIQKYSFFTLPSFDGSNLKDYLIGFFYIDSENNEIQITQNVYEILSTKDIEIFAKWNNEDIEKYYFTDLLEIILSEDNSYAIVKSYTGIANKIVIPRLYKVNGVDYKVLEISSDCFNNNTNIEEVVINSEELVIGDNAFNKCKITSFDFNKVKSIGKYAFANTSLVEVNLSSILTKIDKGAFSGSKLTKVTFIGTPQNLTSIPEKCFENCENLNQITFNSNINEIGNQAFYGCNSLENLEFLKNLSDNSTLHDNVFENCNSLTSVTLNYNIQLIGNTIFKGCENLTELKIYRFYYISEYYNFATFFGDSKISNVVLLEDYETSIPKDYFKDNAQIKSFVMSDDIVTVGANAFVNCTNLETIVLSKSLELENFKIDNFKGSKWFNNLADILVIENTVVYIPANDNLKNVVIPEGVEVIVSAVALKNKKIQTLSLPSSLLVINKDAFKGCSNLKTINFAANSKLEVIDSSAFENCSKLNKVSFVNCQNLTTLGKNAFFNCGNDESFELEIPSSLTSIGEGAFAGFDISGFVSNNLIYQVDEFGNLYESDENGQKITLIYFVNEYKSEIFVLPTSVTKISSYAFMKNQGLYYLYISSDVSLSSNAIYDCMFVILYKDSINITGIEQYEEMGICKILSLMDNSLYKFNDSDDNYTIYDITFNEELYDENGYLTINDGYYYIVENEMTFMLYISSGSLIYVKNMTGIIV